MKIFKFLIVWIFYSRWIQEDYNKLYVHSKLGYMSPEEFEAKYEERIRKVA